MSQGVDADLEYVARVHRALGDPIRLKILRLLPRNPRKPAQLCSVCALSEQMGLPQPTVSHHLKVLRHAGIISFVKKANNVYYYLEFKCVRNAYRDLCTEVFIKKRPPRTRPEPAPV
jgi:DNA-binding transcriptional ArsR family regulator